MPGSYQRDPGPWEQWTVAQWQMHRDRAAALLAADPSWVVGPGVVAQADQAIARLLTVDA